MSDLVHALLEEIAADPAAVERLREIVGPPQGPDGWVGVPEAAAHLNCKRQRIYDLVSQRAIPHRREGSRLLFRLADLDRWLRHP